MFHYIQHIYKNAIIISTGSLKCFYLFWKYNRNNFFFLLWRLNLFITSFFANYMWRHCIAFLSKSFVWIILIIMSLRVVISFIKEIVCALRYKIFTVRFPAAWCCMTYDRHFSSSLKLRDLFVIYLCLKGLTKRFISTLKSHHICCFYL